MGADSDDEEDNAHEGDNDGDFPDKDPLVLSDSDVEAILDGIADFRGSPVDWDYGEDGSDSFAPSSMSSSAKTAPRISNPSAFDSSPPICNLLCDLEFPQGESALLIPAGRERNCKRAAKSPPVSNLLRCGL